MHQIIDGRTVHVFPTPVGMNLVYERQPQQPDGVPHARGDEPLADVVETGGTECSPRPWG